MTCTIQYGKFMEMVPDSRKTIKNVQKRFQPNRSTPNQTQMLLNAAVMQLLFIEATGFIGATNGDANPLIPT